MFFLSRDSKIGLITTLLIGGTVLTFAFNFLIQGYYLGRPWPMNSFMEKPQYFGNDFTRIYRIVEGRTPYANLKNHMQEPMPYLPEALIGMLGFTLMPIKMALVVFYGVFVAFFFWLNRHFLSVSGRIENMRNLFIFTLMTYPFLYLLDRGNMEGYAFLFMVGGLMAYFSGKIFWAATLFVLATGIKIYPALFLLLFLRDRRYKEFLWSFLSGVTLTFLCGFIFKEDMLTLLQGFLQEVKNTNVFFFTPWHYRCLSLATFFRMILERIKGVPFDIFHPGSLVLLYNIFSFFMLLVVYVALLKRKLRRWEELMLLVGPMLLLPPMSHNYKLLLIFAPLYYFVNEAIPNRWDPLYCIMFFLLLTPKNYILGVETVIHISVLIVFCSIILFRAFIPEIKTETKKK